MLIYLILDMIAITSIIIFALGNNALYSSEKFMSGLVGAWYGEADLTRCKDADLIKTLEQVWDESDDYGKEWSAKWEGILIAPASDEITFYAETVKRSR